jgi:hypothetical protein
MIVTAAGANAPREPPPGSRPAAQALYFWKKNRGLVSKPDMWRLLPRMLALRAGRSFGPANILSRPGVSFVAIHHKAMTTYFHAVLRSLAFALNLPFEATHFQRRRPDARLLLFTQSKMDLDSLGPYRGVHVMRDPRDMIVSGYHYHKWAHEAWLHRLDDHGESYQEKLNRLDKTSGLFQEIDHFIFSYRQLLEDWDLDDPDMLEISYEDLMGPEREVRYREIFRHLGFEAAEFQLGVDLMRLFEASSRSGNKSGKIAEGSHLRSGRSRQWEAELEPAHLAYIDRELGHVLAKFGYS